MSEIKRILLIPAEGHPHGLLREGPCGARPPRVFNVGGKWSDYQDFDGGYPCALVLAWDGEPVPEGCFRAVDDLDILGANTTEWHLFVELITSILAGELRAWSDMPKTNVDALADLMSGALVLLDADGREVSDE